MYDNLQAEYNVYAHFRNLGYDKAKALTLLSIVIEMIAYEEMDDLWKH